MVIPTAVQSELRTIYSIVSQNQRCSNRIVLSLKMEVTTEIVIKMKPKDGLSRKSLDILPQYMFEGVSNDIS